MPPPPCAFADTHPKRAHPVLWIQQNSRNFLQINWFLDHLRLL